jgi:glutamate carboxypeptidase
MTTARTSAILDGIRRWVEIERPTTDANGINRLMTLVANDFGAAGAHVSRIAGRDGYSDYLSIVLPWGTGRSGNLVLCHLDTVHPSGTLAHIHSGSRMIAPSAQVFAI